MLRATGIVVVPLLAWLAASPHLAAGEELEERDSVSGLPELLQRSGELEQGGAYERARWILERRADGYPQSYELHLQLGWLANRAERYRLGARYYRQAQLLSGASADSLTGEGWSLMGMGRRPAARRQFQLALAQSPGDEDAITGLERSRRPLDWGLSGSATADIVAYPEHPDSLWAAGLTTRLDGRIEGLTFGAVYRFLQYTQRVEMMKEWDDSVEINDGFSRNELHLHAGGGSRGFGITGHYALLDYPISEGVEFQFVGARARLRLLGEVALEASYTIRPEDDDDIFRTELEWRIPLTPYLSVTPGGAMQVIEGQALGVGLLNLELADERGSIGVGGRIGREIAPVYLSLPAIYDPEGTILGGGWLTGSVRLSDHLELVQALEVFCSQVSEQTKSEDAVRQTTLIGNVGLRWRM